MLVTNRMSFISIALMAVLTACGARPDPEAERISDRGGENVEVLELEESKLHHRFHSVEMDVAKTSMSLKLRWDLSWPIPTENTVLGLCLPMNCHPEVRVMQADLAGEPVRIIPKRERLATGDMSLHHLDDGAGSIEYMGVLRNWPIYRLQLDRQVWGPIKRHARDDNISNSDSHHFDITLKISWEKPFDVQLSSGHGETDKNSLEWQKVAAGLVCNPEALALFQIRSPDVIEYASYVEAHPVRLSARAKSWARVDISSDSLVRLNLDELLKLGFSGTEVSPEAIRIFSRGKPVNHFRVGSKDPVLNLEPGIYFKVLPGDGNYSRNRTYWITTDASLPEQSIPVLSSDRLTYTRPPFLPVNEPPTLRYFRRDIEINHDRVFRVRHGSFLAIEDMAWVNSELEVGTPLDTVLALSNLFLDDKSSTFSARRFPRGGPAEQIKVELDFFIDRSMILNRKNIEVMIGGRDACDITIYGSKDLHQEFSIPGSLLHDEYTTLSLLLKTRENRQGDQNESSGIWLDKIRVNYPSTPEFSEGSIRIRPEHVDGTEFWIPLDENEPSTPAMLAMRVRDDGRIMGQLLLEKNPIGQDGIYWHARPGEFLEIYDKGAIGDITRLATAKFDDLTSQTEPVDLLIITHRQFWMSAENLAQFHRSRGLYVRIVNIQDVYDNFSHGELSPESIRRFLACTLREWIRGGPSHVLLMGDCNSDYLDLVGQNVRNWIPTYTYKNGLEKWASDYWMTTVTPGDDLPDFSLGRISVTNRKDAAAVVSKLIRYSKESRPGPWNSRLAYVSDDGEFPSVVDALRTKHTPPAFSAELIYLDELPYEDNWLLDPGYVEDRGMKVSGSATRAILDTFRKGVSYMTYFGHGSPNIWADERIWFGGDSVNSDNQHLADSGFMTFVANMTCNSGAIDYPQPPWNICITEVMLRVPDGGAIACYVPSGPGTTVGHRKMSIQLHRVLFDDRMRRLGLVVALARSRFAMEKQHKDLLYMFHLLGDPLTDLQLTREHSTVRFQNQYASPGTSVRGRISGLGQEPGRWSGVLTNGHERVVWASGEQAYRGGELQFEVGIPEMIEPGVHHLKIKKWTRGSGGDQVVSGLLNIKYPLLRAGLIHFSKEDETGSSKHVLNITLRNHGNVQGCARLDLELHGDDIPLPRLSEIISLEAGDSKYWSREIPLPYNCRMAHVSGSLTASKISPDPTVPAIQHIDFSQPIGQNASGAGIRRPCILEYDLAGRRGDIRVMAHPGDMDVGLIAGFDSHEGETLATVILRPGRGDELGIQSGLFEFDHAEINSLTSSTLWLMAMQDHERYSKTHSLNKLDGIVLDRIFFKDIVRRRPLLEIVPDSIMVRPRNPSEGQTIFIECDVENTGNTTAFMPGIALTRQLEDGGEKMLRNLVGENPVRISDIAPGRRTSVQLRWDPHENSGVQDIVIRLMHLADGMQERIPHGERMLSLKVKTPPDLSVVRIWIDELTSRTLQQQKDIIRTGRLTLHCEVRNTGETSMPRVIVEFYRSRVQVSENMLGSVELEKVPGEGSAIAVFSWEFDPDKEFIQGMKPPLPSVKAYRKGSTHRITGLPQE